MSDTTLRAAEGVIVMSLVVFYTLTFATHRLRRTRPDFRVAVPVAVGVPETTPFENLSPTADRLAAP